MTVRVAVAAAHCSGSRSGSGERSEVQWLSDGFVTVRVAVAAAAASEERVIE